MTEIREPENQAVQTAREMTKAINDQTKAINETNSRTKTLQRVFVVLCVVILLLAGVAYTNYNNAQTACRRDNDLRRAQQDLWGPIYEHAVANPPEAPGPDATPEEIEEFERQAATLVQFGESLKAFTIHGC